MAHPCPAPDDGPSGPFDAVLRVLRALVPGSGSAWLPNHDSSGRNKFSSPVRRPLKRNQGRFGRGRFNG